MLFLYKICRITAKYSRVKRQTDHWQTELNNIILKKSVLNETKDTSPRAKILKEWSEMYLFIGLTPILVISRFDEGHSPDQKNVCRVFKEPYTGSFSNIQIITESVKIKIVCFSENACDFTNVIESIMFGCQRTDNMIGCSA